MSEVAIPNFFIRLAALSRKRIYESKYTQAFTVLVILTTLICIILESIIVNSHVEVYDELITDKLIIDVPTTSVDPENIVSSTNLLALDLRRLKNENVFFILLSLFQLVLGIDAGKVNIQNKIIRQSVIQLMAHTLIQIFAVIFAAIQVGGTIQKNNEVKTDFAQKQPEDPTVVWNFNNALKTEIGLVSTMTLLSCIFIFLCWKLYKQFGWNIYKRIGADIKQQKRFRMAQIFLLNLKVDAFFQLVLCVFYSVVMTQEKYYELLGTINRKFIGYIIHIVLTVLLIPGLIYGRHGVITENKSVMIAFIFTQFIMGLDFILVLVDSAGSWVFWNLAVSLAICICISTIVLSILVSRNFDKGLKPFMQRLFESEEAKNKSQNANETLIAKKPTAQNEWLIDDEEESYQM